MTQGYCDTCVHSVLVTEATGREWRKCQRNDMVVNGRMWCEEFLLGGQTAEHTTGE